MMMKACPQMSLRISSQVYCLSSGATIIVVVVDVFVLVVSDVVVFVVFVVFVVVVVVVVVGGGGGGVVCISPNFACEWGSYLSRELSLDARISRRRPA